MLDADSGSLESLSSVYFDKNGFREEFAAGGYMEGWSGMNVNALVEVIRSTTGILEPEFSHAVTGPDLIAFQRLVRRVPVAEPVMRYALSLVRASRPKSPTVVGSGMRWAPKASR